MEELGAAIQMIQVTLQGISIAGKATKETLKMLQRLMIFVACTAKDLGVEIEEIPGKLKYHKKRGKTNIDNLRKKGGTLEVVSLNKEEYEKFKKLAKKWGILYTQNPVAKDMEKVYLSYATEQAPNMEKILEAIKKEKLINYKKEAAKEAEKLNLRGKEKKEFTDSYIEMAVNRFQEDNGNCSVEEYFEKSALGTCTNEEFDLLMREKFGDIYDEVKDWEQDLKKTDFKDIIQDLSKYRKNTPPVYLCKQNQPESYIEVSWEIRENEDGKEFLNTQYQVFRDGEKQRCDEFPHGKFWHYTQKSGQASSEHGDNHWEKMVQEMKRKGGFDDEILVFENEQEYLNYKEKIQRVKEYEKTFTENTMLQEWEKRREQSVVLQLDRNQIVDYDEINRKCKVDTGICDDRGRHYYMRTAIDNIFYTAEHKFEVLMKPDEEITLHSYFGTEKIILDPKEIGNTEKMYHPEKEELPEQTQEPVKVTLEKEQKHKEENQKEPGEWTSIWDVLYTDVQTDEKLVQSEELMQFADMMPKSTWYSSNPEEEKINLEQESTRDSESIDRTENEDILWKNPDLWDAYLEEQNIQDNFNEPEDWRNLWDTAYTDDKSVKVTLEKKQSVQPDSNETKKLETLRKSSKTLKKNMIQESKEMIPDKQISR